MLLHILVWLGWRDGDNRPPPAEPRPALRIHLLEAAARPQPAAAPVSATRNEVRPRRAADSRAFAPPAKRLLASQEQAPANIPANTPGSGNLLEQAKGQIDREARRRMLDPMFAEPVRPAEPVLSPLARALGVPVIGESRLGDRLYQYTTAGGRRFCVSVPPDIDLANRDLPIPARTLVPTNCPQ